MRSLLAILFALLAPAWAGAASTGTNTLIRGAAIDGGPMYGWTADGTFDADATQYDPVLNATILPVHRMAGSGGTQQQEKRAAWEFQIPSEALQPGATITGATFTFKKSQYGQVVLATPNRLKVYAYAADGQMTLADFARNQDLVDEFVDFAGPWFDADVTAYLQALVAAGASKVGFLVAAEHVDSVYELDSDAQITIEYTPPVPVNAPPAVAITAPAPNAQFTSGAAITFTGTASDPEGGPVSAITWMLIPSGTVLGTGSSITATLPIGTHNVQASATDNLGWTGSSAITVNVVAAPNAAPTVTITSPAPNAQFAAGAAITFSATAVDPEGAAVSPIQWSLAATGLVLGNGSSITVSSLAPGTHTIEASSSDGAKTGFAAVTVTVVSSTSAYCNASATSSSYEWIKQVAIGTWSNLSNNNGGYGNFTSAPAVPVLTGANSVTLTPGFSSGMYTENWRIWIDLNQNGTFESGELLFSGSSSAAVSGTLTIPSTAMTGTTRMRIAMSYGSGAQPCGTFSYGEVEDYTVDIGVGTAPPPPPPPPPPTAYCASKGSNATYEWIQQLTVAGTPRSTGRNGGYADFTASTAPIALARGANAVSLVPGFGSGSYSETWRIWIDFNGDKVFGADELVFSGPASSTTIASSISVPAAALAGNTRMRVSMKYGSAPAACETFTYGEVEDYTVSIP